MSRFVVAALLASALVSFDARAEDWTTTFDADAVASHFDGKASFIVVTAGDPGDSLTGAGSALEAALKAKGRADLVMNGKSLGSTADLDDPAIVKKASALPVTRIAIVRVFGTKAVITVYDPQAAVVVAFSGDAGTRLGSRSGAVGSGVSSQAAGAIAVLRTEGGKDDKKKAAAKQEFLEKAIWFQDMVGMNQYGAVVSSWSDPVMGMYKKPIPGDKFYDAVGRPDLAEIYRERSSTRSTWMLSGLGALVVGSTVLTIGFVKALGGASDPCEFESDLAGCQATHADEIAAASSAKTTSRVLMVAGGVLLIGSSVAMCKGGGIDPNPVDAPEARRLANEHNKKLLEDLGLTDDDFEDNDKPRKSSIHLSGVSVLPTPGGAYASLQLRF